MRGRNIVCTKLLLSPMIKNALAYFAPLSLATKWYFMSQLLLEVAIEAYENKRSSLFCLIVHGHEET
jgi:hypothetical protein